MAGAEAAYREALRLDSRNFYAHNGLGNTLLGKGDLAGAEAAYREAVKLDPKFVKAYLNLGVTFTATGDLDGAVAAYQEALRIYPKNAFALWKLPVAERMRDLLRRLPDILAGRAEPTTPAECYEFAELCIPPFQQRYAAAVRLSEKAFAADSGLAADLAAFRRYNAACYAARAARGDGSDAPADPSDRAALRAKVLDWLRADLAAYRQQAASSNPIQRKTAADRLSHWLRDSDLSHVRHPFLLAALPAAEVKLWLALWAEVHATRAEALKPPPPDVAPPPRPKP